MVQQLLTPNSVDLTARYVKFVNQLIIARTNKIIFIWNVNYFFEYIFSIENRSMREVIDLLSSDLSEFSVQDSIDKQGSTNSIENSSRVPFFSSQQDILNTSLDAYSYNFERLFSIKGMYIGRAIREFYSIMVCYLLWVSIHRIAIAVQILWKKVCSCH